MVTLDCLVLLFLVRLLVCLGGFVAFILLRLLVVCCMGFAGIVCLVDSVLLIFWLVWLGLFAFATC